MNESGAVLSSSPNSALTGGRHQPTLNDRAIGAQRLNTLRQIRMAGLGSGLSGSIAPRAVPLPPRPTTRQSSVRFARQGVFHDGDHPVGRGVQVSGLMPEAGLAYSLLQCTRSPDYGVEAGLHTGANHGSSLETRSPLIHLLAGRTHCPRNSHSERQGRGPLFQQGRRSLFRRRK